MSKILIATSIGLAALYILPARAGCEENVSADEPGFVPLFNGKSLVGWMDAMDSYRVEDGNLVSLEGGFGNLLTEKTYADFVLRFEFLLTSGANNGLLFRCPINVQSNLHQEGIELQILDNSFEQYKTLEPFQYHGSVYGVVPAKRGFLKPVGQWNQQEVIAKGRHVKVILNGTTIVDANFLDASLGGTLDGQDHPGLLRSSGRIGFAGHGDRIEVRHLRIKEISH